MPHTSASYSFTARLVIPQEPGAFARVATVIGDAGGSIGAIDIVRSGQRQIWRDITVAAADSAHAQKIVDDLAEVPGVEVENVSDRTFLIHLGGKLEVRSRVPLKTRDDLSMAYTPGVARICKSIAADPRKAWALTVKRNTVAVVTDGTAVLGLGDIGPLAAMPVMEGKAALFKQLAGVDAWPIALDRTDVDEVVEAVAAIAPGFGGINLEDIAAPRCFEIERKLQERLDIPVFHDDQHGTAVVVLAALANAAQVVDKTLTDLRVVVLGIGAAGTAIAQMLVAAGITDVTGVDRSGALYRGRTVEMDDAKHELAQITNPNNVQGDLETVIQGADVFIGVSGPGALKPEVAALMADDAIVFAMANPDPELTPSEAPNNVAVMATGRSDYPNQINNVLCFPGVFRGALDARASRITESMKLAAASAIASCVSADELNSEYIVPGVFNPQVAERVAEAVGDAARGVGVARKQPPETNVLHLPE